MFESCRAHCRKLLVTAYSGCGWSVAGLGRRLAMTNEKHAHRSGRHRGETEDGRLARRRRSAERPGA